MLQVRFEGIFVTTKPQIKTVGAAVLAQTLLLEEAGGGLGAMRRHVTWVALLKGELNANLEYFYSFGLAVGLNGRSPSDHGSCQLGWLVSWLVAQA